MPDNSLDSVKNDLAELAKLADVAPDFVKDVERKHLPEILEVLIESLTTLQNPAPLLPRTGTETSPPPPPPLLRSTTGIPLPPPGPGKKTQNNKNKMSVRQVISMFKQKNRQKNGENREPSQYNHSKGTVMEEMQKRYMTKIVLDALSDQVITAQIENIKDGIVESKKLMETLSSRPGPEELDQTDTALNTILENKVDKVESDNENVRSLKSSLRVQIKEYLIIIHTLRKVNKLEGVREWFKRQRKNDALDDEAKTRISTALKLILEKPSPLGGRMETVAKEMRIEDNAADVLSLLEKETAERVFRTDNRTPDWAKAIYETCAQRITDVKKFILSVMKLCDAKCLDDNNAKLAVVYLLAEVDEADDNDNMKGFLLGQTA